jgi:hypothetical protein
VDALTQAIKIVVFGQSVDELDELVLVYEVGALGGEDNITGGLSGDSEPERWIITPVKCKVEVVMRIFSLGSRDEILGNDKMRRVGCILIVLAFVLFSTSEFRSLQGTPG